MHHKTVTTVILIIHHINTELCCTGEVVEADLGEARRCVALARQNLEDPTFGMKYLANIVKNPDEVKYRTLKLSNR